MDYAVSDGEILKLGPELPGDMDIDVTLIDCGSSCDVRGSPEEAEDANFAKVAEERAEIADMSDATPPRKKGRRPRNELLDLGAADDPIAYELKQGYRILRELMDNSSKSVNAVFMNYPVDDNEDPQYREKIASPMWLTKMQEKFRNREYSSITDFVKDFRLMLENCYRFNGPDHYVSKKAQKLEHMLELKLGLLSREVRVKTTLEATSGQTVVESSGAAADSAADESNVKEHSGSESPAGRRIRRAPLMPLPCPGSLGALAASSSTVLLNRLREEERERERDARRRLQEDRRKELEQLIQELQQWEQNFVDEQTRREMRSMWELPHIGHFLCLCRGPLNIPEVAQHELERILLMPTESSALSALMTSLLSTPQQRIRMRNHAPMPFAVWEAKLRARLDMWYKAADIAAASSKSVDEQLGIDNRFFDIVGHQNPLPRKSFTDLSYLQKVWILKALCEYCVHSQEAVREAIDLQPADEARESILGQDADGRTYLHFPQFRTTDIRVYRLAAVPTRGLDRLPAEKASRRKRAGSKTVKTAPRVPAQDAKTADRKANGQQIRVNGDCISGDLVTGTSCVSSRSERQPTKASAANGECRPEKLPCTPVRRSARNRLRHPDVESVPRDREHSADDDLLVDGTSSPDRSTIVAHDFVGTADLPAASMSPLSAGATCLTRCSRRCAGETSPATDAVNGCEHITDGERTTAANQSESSRTSPQTVADCGVVLNSSEVEDCRSDLISLREEKNALQPLSTKHSLSAPQNDRHSKSDVGTAGEDEGLVIRVTEFEAFQLVASSVAELRDLISKLDLSSASSNDAKTSGTEKSVNASSTDKPPGEFGLRENLQSLLKDVEPFESRLESARRRICEKLRREMFTYKPPPPLAADDKVLLEWDSDEDEAAGKKQEQQPGSVEGSDDGCESKDGADSAAAAVSRSCSKHGADLSEATATQLLPDLKEGESWDVSSFGRLRKRRIIPNNVEDSGMPRKRASTAPAPVPGGGDANVDTGAATADANLVVSVAGLPGTSDGARVQVKLHDPGSSEEDCTIISHSVAATSSSSSTGTLIVPQATPTAGSGSAAQINAAASNSGSYNLISIDGKIYLMPSSHVASLLGDSAAVGRSTVVVGGSSSVTDAAKNAAQPINNAFRFPMTMSNAPSSAFQSAGQGSRTALLVGAPLAGGAQAVATPVAALSSGTTIQPAVLPQQPASTTMSCSRPAVAAGVAEPATAMLSLPTGRHTVVSGLPGSAFAYQPILQSSGGGTRLVLSTVPGTGHALGTPTSSQLATSSHLAFAQTYLRPAVPGANHAGGTNVTTAASQAGRQQLQQQQAATITVPTGGALLTHVAGAPSQQLRPDQRLLLTYTPSSSHGRLQAALGSTRPTGVSPLNVVQYAPGSAVTQLRLAKSDLLVQQQQHGQPSAQLFVYQQPQLSSAATRPPVGRVAPSVVHSRTSAAAAGSGPLLIAAAAPQQQQQLLLLNLNAGQLVQQHQAHATPLVLVDERALIGVQPQQQPQTAAAVSSTSGPGQATEPSR